MAQRRGRLPAFRRGPQRRPKKVRRWPGRVQEDLNSAPGSLQTALTVSKEASRRPKEAPEMDSESARRPKSALRRTKGPQGASEAPQRRCQDAASGPEEGTKGTPGLSNHVECMSTCAETAPQGTFSCGRTPPERYPPGDFCETFRKSLPPGSLQPPATPLGRVSRGCARLHTGPWEGTTGPMSAPRGP